MSLRRPHLGACALTALALCAAPAAATADSGGAAAPVPGAAPTVPVSDPGAFLVNSKRSAFVDDAVAVKGTVPAAAGRAVSIELDSSSGWTQVATGQGDSSGSFIASWKAAAPGRFRLRALVAGAQSAQQGPGLASVPREVTVYKPAKATWYGPGFYGRKTACGDRLTKSTLGIAHKELPCGTQVAITYKGRTVDVPVIDRGPYANGADIDLTSATADQLGARSTLRVGMAVLPDVQP